MKVYHFAKDIVRGNFYYNDLQYKDEYTSSEELIKAYNETLEIEEETPLTEDEIASIFYEDMPGYDYYAIQYWIENRGCGLETATAITFKTYEECTAWIADNGDEYEGTELKIVGQRWGWQYIHYFDN